MLLEWPCEMLTREENCRELWPDEAFVDYERCVNSAVNRLREALGDKASNPRFVETLTRRGYRFLASVERIVLEEEASTMAIVAQVSVEPLTVPTAQAKTGFLDRILATEDLQRRWSLEFDRRNS